MFTNIIQTTHTELHPFVSQQRLPVLLGRLQTELQHTEAQQQNEEYSAGELPARGRKGHEAIFPSLKRFCRTPPRAVNVEVGAISFFAGVGSSSAASFVGRWRRAVSVLMFLLFALLLDLQVPEVVNAFHVCLCPKSAVVTSHHVFPGLFVEQLSQQLPPTFLACLFVQHWREPAQNLRCVLGVRDGSVSLPLVCGCVGAPSSADISYSKECGERRTVFVGQ